MTLQTWLKSAAQQLKDIHISSAIIDSQLILGHVLGQDKVFLITHADDVLSESDEANANVLLERRLKHEPMAFLLGSREFYGLQLKTDSRALIPRGESEALVQAALDWLKTKSQPQLVVEVGTGSGAIACALATHAPSHRYVATELDEGALALAKENAHKLNLPIEFRHGDLCAPLEDLEGKIDLLVANLPYIAQDLLTVLDPTVQYFEPHLALSGGSDGLDLYRQFFPQAQKLLARGACIIVEHEFDHGETMRELIKESFPDWIIETKVDFSGHDRITLAKQS